MNSRTLLLILLLASTGAAAAAELRKCVAPDGHVAFLDAACPPGTSQAWSRAVTPDPVPPSAPQTRAAGPTSREAESPPAGRGASVRRGSAASPRRADRCRAVREAVAREEARVGLKRTFAMLRAWQERIDRECFGL